ncbi:PepSY domain-containing protein [Actinoplanes sp. NPDC049681]|uniref:PepSY domain-containing protein n=1 Tax=Actinoplanes sp. NPDC049681 TaxID=3363905 RepID=UPI0037B9DC77
MNRLRTASTLAAGAVFALALGGVALASDGADDASGAVPMLPNGDVVTSSPAADDSGHDATDDSKNTTAPSTSSPAGAGAISLDAAKVIAIRAAGGGRVTKVEQEIEHGRAVWDVEVLKGSVEHDIDVDQATGAVVRHRQDAGKGRSGSTSDDKGTDDRGRGRDDKGTDDRGRGSDDTQADDKGGLRGGHSADDTQADDKGGLRGGHSADDTQADDKGGRRGGHGADDTQADDRGGRGRGSDD